jgi:hypothetical protein
LYLIKNLYYMCRGHRGRDRISAYHPYSCKFESRSGEVYSIQHYVIKFVSDLRQVWFFPVSSTNKTDRHDITEILLKVALNTISIYYMYIN